MSPLTENERKEKALQFFENLSETITNLYSRYLDEKGFENIDEYAIVFRSEVEKIGGDFVKANKRPFGFDYRLGGGYSNGATYRVSIDSKGRYSYRRIA